eukprot:TRINITY_DN3265_c0_g5_i1.p1 TRINITY_DN3265_c0_g5~~TRINITY_DN3265_c0_g5_i1.p1  ORF type:complete len:352 (+),score=100.14 TRINITY_DN3265_c0_g5_i1:35-1057(+)
MTEDKDDIQLIEPSVPTFCEEQEVFGAFTDLPNKPTLLWRIFRIIFLPLTLIRVLFFTIFTVVFLTLSVLIISFPIGVKRASNSPIRRALFAKSTQFGSKILLLALGFIRVKVTDLSEGSKGIYIGNHSVFVDILFVLSSLPVSLIGKVGVKNMPIVGACATGIDCVFVDRADNESKKHVMEEIDKRADLIQKGSKRKLMLFPEGTCTNGHSLVSFKKGAFNPMKPVIPITLRYHTHGYESGWVAKSLWRIYFRLALNPWNSGNITIHKAVVPKKKETVDQFTDRCRKVMAEKLSVPLEDTGFAEHRPGIDYYEGRITFEEAKKRVEEAKKARLERSNNR